MQYTCQSSNRMFFVYTEKKLQPDQTPDMLHLTSIGTKVLYSSSCSYSTASSLRAGYFKRQNLSWSHTNNFRTNYIYAIWHYTKNILKPQQATWSVPSIWRLSPWAQPVSLYNVEIIYWNKIFRAAILGYFTLDQPVPSTAWSFETLWP